MLREKFKQIIRGAVEAMFINSIPTWNNKLKTIPPLVK